MAETTLNAVLQIIGVNPYVDLPVEVLKRLFDGAGKDKGPIPVRGKVNKKEYRQTLVRFQGSWRLYINTTMLKNSPGRVGETLELTVEFDPDPRVIPMDEGLRLALEAHPEAQRVFDAQPPSLQAEIVRYIARLKSDEAKARNIDRAIGFLQGKERFIGRPGLSLP